MENVSTFEYFCKFLQVLACILLEQRVIFISENYSLITLVMEVCGFYTNVTQFLCKCFADSCLLWFFCVFCCTCVLWFVSFCCWPVLQLSFSVFFL